MFLEQLKVSMALCCLWAWLIPHFYIEFMEYRVALKQSRGRSPSNSNINNNSNNDDVEDTASSGEDDDDQLEQQDRNNKSHNNHTNVEDNDDDNSRRDSSVTLPPDEANKALIRGVATAILIIIVVYVASATLVALATRNMDRRADAVVVGMGRILSAFLFAVFSVEIPKWLGVTYSSQRANYYKQQISHNKGLKELSFRVCWSILGHFFVVYSIMLLHFTKPTPWSIQISTATGVCFGFGVIWAVYVGRTTYRKHTTLIAAIFSMAIMVSSAAAFSAGCWYIKEVWYEEDIGYQDEYTLLTFFGWLFLCMLANLLYYRLTRRKLKKASTAATDGNSTTGVASSLPGAAADFSDAKSTWRYQVQTFEPPESVCFAATELSKATAHVAVATVRSPFKRAGSTLTRIRTSSFGSSTRNGTPRHEDDVPSGNDVNYTPTRRRAVSADAGATESLPQPTPIRARTNTEPTPDGAPCTPLGVTSANNRARSYSDTSYSSHAYAGEESIKRLDDLKLESFFVPPSSPPTNEVHFSSTCNDPLDTIKTGVAMSFGEDLSDSLHALSFESTARTSASVKDSALVIRPSVDVEERIEEGDGSEDESVVIENEPSLWFMIKRNSCCGKRRHYQAPPRKRWERILIILKWTLVGITNAMHLYFLVICIGATMQQDRVRNALPKTFELLYPPDYVESKMCAWNESSPSADIRSFDSLDAVSESNYTVIHCGACGACSNWDDLNLQWTTRGDLAALGQECVQKKFFGGTEQDVQDCNEELIGFSEECARCWTVDQLCAKKNCVFIYLQSLLVNEVSNFNVDPDDISTATCDEALCGPEFVPCSGATRRRMNIVSDIARPKDQQCTVANENWSSVFNFP